MRVCALVASSAAVIAIAWALGGFASLGDAASGVTGVARHAVAGDAGDAPRASAVIQDEANAPGFRMRIKHRRSVVPAGGTAIFVLRLRSFYAFNSLVRLRIVGLPASTRATFRPEPTRPTGTAILRIQTGETSPLGRYVFRVLGTSKGVNVISLSTLTIR
jgi:hypothetical protein